MRRSHRPPPAPPASPGPPAVGDPGPLGGLPVAHCEAAGGATFAPMARALRTLLRIDDGSVAEHAREGGRVNVLETLVEAGQRGNAVRAAIGSVLPRDDDADRGRIVGGIAALL